MSRLFATYDFTAKRPAVWTRLVFIMGCLVWPLRVLSTHERLQSISVAPRSLSTVRMVPSKECCVHALAFPSQWTHLAFAADHPSGRFWLSKITFWVDYTLSAASSNYSFALRWAPNSHRSSVVRTMRAQRQGESRPAWLAAAWLPRATDKQQTSLLHSKVSPSLQRNVDFSNR